ncbi:MAG: flagellin, partial [Pseudomonadota bacterium]
AALSAAANFQLESEGRAGETVLSASGNVITVTNNDDTAVTGALAAGDFTLTDDGTIGGGLEILGDIDVSTTNGADAASAAIDYLIETAVGAAADLGTSQSRMQIQNDFISSLSDSLKSGIGALVDANMEEASARLQALQVQQQLAIQSLSIANQAPQNILSLFR